MFDTVVKKLVKTIGVDLYIPSSSIAASENLSPLALVERKASRWWLGSNSYYSTDFSLSDVISNGGLKADLEPEKVLVSYSKTSVIKVNGSLAGHFKSIFDAELDNVDTITLKADLGELHFLEASEQSLLNSLQSRKLNMSHELIRELLAKQRRALCVVVGVVKTTVPTTITATLNFKLNADEKVSSCIPSASAGEEMKGGVEDDRTRTLNLPAGTVLAYQVAELAINDAGSVRMMVTYGAKGGFHADLIDAVDAVKISPELDHSSLEQLRRGFASLPADRRKSLAEQLLLISEFPEARLELSTLLYDPASTSSKDQVQSVLNLLGDRAKNEDLIQSVLLVTRALRNLDDFGAASSLSSVPVSQLPALYSVVESTYTGSGLSYVEHSHSLPAAPESLEFLIVGLGYTLDGDGLRPPATGSKNLLNSAYAAVFGLHTCSENMAA